MTSFCPIIIVGNPRSGTSMLRLMLTSHNNICIPPECPLIYKLEPQFGSVDFSTEGQIHSFVSQLKTITKIETWNLDFDLLEQELGGVKNFPEAIEKVYLRFIKQQEVNKKIWGDKSGTFTINGLKKLSPYFKNAFIIYLVRDGRDIAVSYKELSTPQNDNKYAPILPGNIFEIAEIWYKNNLKILKFLKGWPESQQITIRYEDLVEQPELVLKNTLKKIGQPYDEEVLNFYLHNQKRSLEPKDFISWKKKTLEDVTTSQIGRYKKKLSENEIKIFEFLNGQTLRRFNYEVVYPLKWGSLISDFSIIKVLVRKIIRNLACLL